MHLVLLVGLTGAVATFVDATIGMGFGVLSTSLLMTIGILPAAASASIHVGKIATGFLSGGSHLWLGNVEREWLLPLALPGALGGAVGAYLLASLPGKAMRPYVAATLLILGFVVLRRYMWRRPALAALLLPIGSGRVANDGGRARPPRRIVVLGFVAAFVDAIGGGGWGPITTSGLILTGRAEPHKVIGTVNVAEVFAAIAISVTFFVTIGLNSLPWTLIVAMLIGGIISAPIGAFLCQKLPTRLLGILTALALIAFNLGIVFDALS